MITNEQIQQIKRLFIDRAGMGGLEGDRFHVMLTRPICRVDGIGSGPRNVTAVPLNIFEQLIEDDGCYLFVHDPEQYKNRHHPGITVENSLNRLGYTIAHGFSLLEVDLEQAIDSAPVVSAILHPETGVVEVFEGLIPEESWSNLRGTSAGVSRT